MLILHLCRYTANVETRRYDKRHDAISFPDLLDIGLCFSSGKPQEPRPYNIRAVIVHRGESPYSGHYVCYARDMAGSWHLYNDEAVSDLPAGLPDECAQSAYILVYSQVGLPGFLGAGAGINSPNQFPRDAGHARPTSNATPPAKRFASGSSTGLPLPEVPALPTSQPSQRGGKVGDWASQESAVRERFVAWYNGPRSKQGGASARFDTYCTDGQPLCAVAAPCQACRKRYSKFKNNAKSGGF